MGSPTQRTKETDKAPLLEGQQPVLICLRYRDAIAGRDQATTRMEFKSDLSGFVPVRMEILQANDSRGGVPVRVCLLGKDEVTYKVFALSPHEELVG